jgi:hypothetical protein
MRQDLEELSRTFASVPIRRRLAATGILSIDNVGLEEPDEYTCWPGKLVTWRGDESDPSSASSPSARMHRARSIDVNIDYLDESESMSVSQGWLDMSGDQD